MQKTQGPNYWRYRSGPIKPEDDPMEECSLNWALDKRDGVINNMLKDVGDVSKYPNKEALVDFVKNVRSGKHKGRARECWDFYDTMKTGEIVFAFGKQGEVFGVGKITSDYYYTGEHPRYHQRKVEWLSTEYHDKISHGLSRAALSRFDLTKENAVKELNRLKALYSDVFDDVVIEADGKDMTSEKAQDTENIPLGTEYIGKIVKHKIWGQGVVRSVADKVIEVEFGDKMKRLEFPGAFQKNFLTIVD